MLNLNKKILNLGKVIGHGRSISFSATLFKYK